MEETVVKEKETELNEAGIEGGKFLSFFLGEEEYAIEILKVQEIIGLMPITPVPKMPSYIRGVLNLRGKIVPVMNLRLRFGLQPVEDTDETCVIVVQDGKYLMGVLVDKVSEVADIITNQIEEVPSFGIEANSDYLAGIAKVQDSVKMIVDVHKVVFDVADEVKAPANAVAQEEVLEQSEAE
ncbi:chemotaxis protein CheW [Gracilimonas mengyeensis]|uniref:Chemotaxis protein CheW n=1 Tax=Gracilimonas mengyeensis TaxID=1302730 RepID=A0A521D8H0_9BACT|nr:chemotaxis protein CheW [Gracilimonas mengyeensis]SMO67371.1 purine-binding chemotaxis protein CheW [Gracilimonas mengyeensis]